MLTNAYPYTERNELLQTILRMPRQTAADIQMLEYALNRFKGQEENLLNENVNIPQKRSCALDLVEQELRNLRAGNNKPGVNQALSPTVFPPPFPLRAAQPQPQQQQQQQQQQQPVPTARALNYN